MALPHALVAVPYVKAQTVGSDVTDSARVSSQSPPSNMALTVWAEWDTARFRSDREPIELVLSRPLTSMQEHIALAVGNMDVSSLTEVRGTRAWMTPDIIRLPAGSTHVTAYLVNSTGEWQELARFPLRVRNRAGLDEAYVRPNVDLNSIGQLDRRDPPDTPPPDRRIYQDLTLRLGFESSMARNEWRVVTQANAVGVTEETQRLRYNDLQSSAPRVDLADYRIQGSRPGLDFVIGHQTVGQHRFLINGFGSRGIGSTVRLGPLLTLDASLLNGSSISGWSNPVGIARPLHRVGTAGIAVELRPSRPGAAQLHLSAISGSLLPQAGFSQAAATDAEQSRGGGVRFVGSDVNQRVRFEAGYARSRFTNPFDPLLAGDETLVPVRAETRAARYGELTVDLLRNAAVFRGVAASLSTTLRHERIDPLYRSVGAFVQSDRDANGLDITGGIGPLALRGAITRGRDNLQNVPSVLTTETRGGSFAAVLPLSSLVNGSPSYLPTASYSNEITRQAGTNVPVNGGFEASHVPDQANVNATMNLNWNVRGFSVDVRHNNSLQDNRQVGRERADFETTVDALTIGGSARVGLDVSFDVSREHQTDVEQDVSRQLMRLGASIRWQPLAHTDLVGMVSHSQGAQPGTEQRVRNVEYQLELSRGFNVYRRLDGSTQGRVFIRYAHTRATVLPFVQQSLFDSRITWTLNAGASMRLF